MMSDDDAKAARASLLDELRTGGVPPVKKLDVHRATSPPTKVPSPEDRKDAVERLFALGAINEQERARILRRMSGDAGTRDIPLGGKRLSDGWRLWHGTDADARLTWDAQEKRSAESSARVDVRSVSDTVSDVDLYVDGIHLRDGGSYTLTFWAKAHPPCTIGLNSRKGGPDWRSYGLETSVEIDKEWSQHSVEFNSKVSARDARLSFWLGAKEGTVWIDGVMLHSAGSVT